MRRRSAIFAISCATVWLAGINCGSRAHQATPPLPPGGVPRADVEVDAGPEPDGEEPLACVFERKADPNAPQPCDADEAALHLDHLCRVEGNRDACTGTAVMALVDQDVFAASERFEVACDQGDADSCTLGGYLYLQGPPQLRRPPRGWHMLRNACALGDDDICEALDTECSYGEPLACR